MSQDQSPERVVHAKDPEQDRPSEDDPPRSRGGEEATDDDPTMGGTSDADTSD